MSDRQNPDGQHEEEDLLADFRDVLGEDDGKEASAGDSTTDLDALDAFLNEFGQAETAPGGDDAATAAAGESGEMAEPIELAADEPEPADVVPDIESTPDLALDTFDSAADEAVAPDDAVDVPELHVEAGVVPDDLNLDVADDLPEPEPMDPARGGIDDMFDLPPAVSTAAGVEPAYTPPPVSIMAAEDEPPEGNRLFDVSTIGVAVFSLVIAAVAGWFALSLHGQMNDLRAELVQLRQQPAGLVTGTDPAIQEAVARLAQRVNEMALVIDGPMSHLSASSQQSDAVNARLDALEQGIGDLRNELVAVRNAKAVTRAADKPAAASTPPAPKAATAAASTPQRSGGWVVNVASLTDSKSAAAEQQRLQQAGFKVEVQTAQMSGRTWYRVRATGFASREEAQVYGDMIHNKMGVTPWVGIEKQ